MDRKLRGGFESDEGISVLEVVFAAFIMFFVLTAVLGLVATSTRMGLSARQRAAVTNAVSSHLEWMRSVEFDTLGLAPDGVVDEETVITVDDFTVTITTQISEASDTTRDVLITAVATGDGFNPMTITRSAVIYDIKSGVVENDETQSPEVELVSPTPASDSIIYGSQVLGTSYQPLYIAARAVAYEDEGYITDLSMYCSNTLLRNGTTLFASYATWEPNEHDYEKSFNWNTLQVDDDGEQTVEDGWRLVTVLATEDNGQQGRAERRYYVDNFGPEDPGVPVAQVNSDAQTRIGWEHAPDGTNYAALYSLKWARIDESGAVGAATTVPGLTTNAYLHVTEPFNRYTASVAASNYRGDTTSYIEMERPYVSRVGVLGSSTLTKVKSRGVYTGTTVVDLAVDSPHFAVSSVQYDVYRVNASSLGISASAPTLSDPPTSEEQEALADWQYTLSQALTTSQPYATDTGPEYTDTIVKTLGSSPSSVADPYFYCFKISFVPSGYKGGTSEFIWSDVVGSTMITAGSNTLEHATW